MAITVPLDPNYGYVILAATSTYFMNMAHVANTGKFRKAAKVAYPAAYAPPDRTDIEAERFNCAQRSHAHFTEHHVTALAGMLIAGLKHPIAAASMGAGWTIMRYLFMTGYSKGNGGKGRYDGAGFWVFQFGLMLLSGYTGVEMILGW